MKMQEKSYRYEDSDPWIVRHADAIAIPLFGIGFAVLLMLPFLV